MTKRVVGYYIKLDQEMREAMRRYKEAVGVPETQQIHRALREWLEERPEAWPLPGQPAKKRSSRRKR